MLIGQAQKQKQKQKQKQGLGQEQNQSKRLSKKQRRAQRRGGPGSPCGEVRLRLLKQRKSRSRNLSKNLRLQQISLLLRRSMLNLRQRKQRMDVPRVPILLSAHLSRRSPLLAGYSGQGAHHQKIPRKTRRRKARMVSLQCRKHHLQNNQRKLQSQRLTSKRCPRRQRPRAKRSRTAVKLLLLLLLYRNRSAQPLRHLRRPRLQRYLLRSSCRKSCLTKYYHPSKTRLPCRSVLL